MQGRTTDELFNELNLIHQVRGEYISQDRSLEWVGWLIDGWMDGWMDRSIDRSIDRLID